MTLNPSRAPISPIGSYGRDLAYAALAAADANPATSLAANLGCAAAALQASAASK